MLVLLNGPMISPTNKPLPGFELTSPDIQGLVLKAGYFPWCTSCRERTNCEQIIYCRCNSDVVQFPSVGRDFSSSQLSMQTVLWCLHSPHRQSHVSSSVYVLKIPNTGSHTTVWTDENITHADRSG